MNKRRKVGEYNISVSSPWKKREGNSTRRSQKVAKYNREKEESRWGGTEHKEKSTRAQKKKGKRKVARLPILHETKGLPRPIL